MITITGLGPGDYDRIPGHVKSILEDTESVVVVRTSQHPAAQTLANLREVVTCDDLYDTLGTFDQVYDEIARRVVDLSRSAPVIYAVPGSPLVGEFAIRRILALAPDSRVIPGESFIDVILERLEYDPLDRGLQILNAHQLPDPLILDKPTIVAQLSSPEVLADTLAAIDAVVPEETPVTLMSDLGSPGSSLVKGDPAGIDISLAGLRTSLFVDPEPGGLVGVLKTVRLLSEECPWDRQQTHRTLVKNLVEETYELVDAIGRLPADGVDWPAYAAVEDELGDVLLQVLMHEAIGRREGAFDIDQISEGLRQKLVRRHPHVFGDAVAGTAAEVKENWDRIKAAEGPGLPVSAIDGIPAGMPAIHRAAKIQNRAAKVGFDWDDARQVLSKVLEEIDEVAKAIDDPGAVGSEIGDLLFSVINLARHLEVDPELALVSTIARFDARFRFMESGGSLAGLSLDEMNRRWEAAKRSL